MNVTEEGYKKLLAQLSLRGINLFILGKPADGKVYLTTKTLQELNLDYIIVSGSQGHLKDLSTIKNDIILLDEFDYIPNQQLSGYPLQSLLNILDNTQKTVIIFSNGRYDINQNVDIIIRRCIMVNTPFLQLETNK